eukprot:s2933_g1.t1
MEAPNPRHENAAPSTQIGKRAIVNDIVNFIHQGQVSRREVLRATPTSKVLHRCCYVLRLSKQEADAAEFHSWSFVTECITEFLSHSWHGSAWAKVILLLILKNGPAAVIMGTMCAIPMMLLFIYELLPGYTRPGQSEANTLSSIWSMSTGLVVALLILILWRPRGSMFVDRVCIDQTSDVGKAEGILNIGAFLKYSESMLVLWDSSYTSRLWCVFELAAFLRCHGTLEEAPPLVVRPTFLAPCTLTIAGSLCGFMVALLFIPFDNPLFGSLVLIAIGSACLYLSAAAFRAYFRDVELMQEHIRSFRVQNAKCFCCSQDHMWAGKKISCDREIVVECISKWFGSIANFEQTVQKTVLSALWHQLGNHPFPYLWLIGASVPLVWGQMDAVASRLRTGDPEMAVVWTLNAFMWWLAAFPASFVIWASLTWRLRARPASRCADVLRNVVGMLALFAFFCIVWLAQRMWLSIFNEDDVAAYASFLSIMTVATCFVWRAWQPPSTFRPQEAELSPRDGHGWALSL